MRLSRAVVDADGRSLAASGEWRIGAMAMDVATMVLTMRLDSGGREASQRLDLRAAEGPRLGRMRDWFEAIDPQVGAPLEPAPSPAPRALSVLADALRGDDLGAAEARPHALAAGYEGENLQTLAERLEVAARELSPLDRARGVAVRAGDRCLVRLGCEGDQRQ